MSDNEVQPKKRTRKPMTEEQKAAARERMAKARAARGAKCSERKKQEKETQSILQELIAERKKAKVKRKTNVKQQRADGSLSTDEEVEEGIPVQEPALLQDESASESQESESEVEAEEQEQQIDIPSSESSDSEEEAEFVLKPKKKTTVKTKAPKKAEKQKGTNLLEELNRLKAELAAVKKEKKSRAGSVKVYVNQEKAPVVGAPKAKLLDL